jgi:hypothetical protein
VKKVINIFCWASVVMTILCSIFIVITSYQKFYISYSFEKNYTVLQKSIFITMLFWSIKLYNLYSGKKKYIYSSISMFFAIGALIFIYVSVY